MKDISSPPERAHRAVLDSAYRLLYRAGFRLARLWWRLRRPRHRGAVVALWHDGRVLVLRQSYRGALHFPGGGLGRGETARSAACRELREEIGLVLSEELLAPAQDWEGWWDYRYDHVTIFEHELASPPRLRPDNREIVAAGFMTPEAALSGSLPPFIRAYLDGAAAAVTRARAHAIVAPLSPGTEEEACRKG